MSELIGNHTGELMTLAIENNYEPPDGDCLVPTGTWQQVVHIWATVNVRLPGDVNGRLDVELTPDEVQGVLASIGDIEDRIRVALGAALVVSGQGEGAGE